MNGPQQFRLFNRYWSTPAALALVVDALLVVAAFSLAARWWLVVAGGSTRGNLALRGAVFTVVVLLHLYGGRLYDFSQRVLARQREIQLLRALSLAAVSLWALYYVTGAVLSPGRRLLAVAIVLTALFLSGWRIGLNWLLGRSVFSERVLIVGADRAALELAEALESRRHLGYLALGFAADDAAELDSAGFPRPLLGDTRESDAIARRERATRVVVAEMGRARPGNLEALLRCKNSGIPVHGGSAYYERLTAKIMLEDVRLKSWLIFSPGFLVSRWLLFLKRATDLLLVVPLAILSAPLLLLLMGGVALTSGRPVFVGRQRVGRGGREVRLWRLRTREAGSREVTRLGRLLLRFRLDKLPEIWSVLVGEMSLVGPRPQSRAFHDRLEAANPIYAQRTAVRPGLTGWAQINVPQPDLDPMEKLKYDLYYIKNISLFLDLTILASTARIVLLGAPEARHGDALTRK